MLADARRFGLSPEQARAFADAQEDGGVWPENAEVVGAFLAVATQWRTAIAGGGPIPAHLVYVGLDYAGVRIALDALRVDVTPELWSGLQIMEAAARQAMNERRA